MVTFFSLHRLTTHHEKVKETPLYSLKITKNTKIVKEPKRLIPNVKLCQWDHIEQWMRGRERKIIVILFQEKLHEITYRFLKHKV